LVKREVKKGQLAVEFPPNEKIEKRKGEKVFGKTGSKLNTRSLKKRSEGLGS